MLITKADGTTEEFKASKLKNSLRKAGATKDEIVDIVVRIENELEEGMTTEVIYRQAFEYLRSTDAPAVARYSLRRAMFGLGPTGFPFEEFLARLFEAEGYVARTQVVLQGKCATHELDVAAYKADHSFVAEAKFHARPGLKSDLQVLLYSYARLLDLKEQKICAEDICGVKNLLVVTNTKFTTTAIDYAECAGVDLLSWSYPAKNNLHDRIRATGLYPITVLQSLSPEQKNSLLKRNVIVCADILKNPNRLRHAHLSQKKTESVLAEAKLLDTKDVK